MQRILTVDGSSTGDLFSALVDFTTDINVRNPEMENLYSQRVEYRALLLAIVIYTTAGIIFPAIEAFLY